MAVSGINYTQSSLQNSRAQLSSGNDLTNKDVFFKILAAELSNQDPLKGKDGTEYIGQLAQFTALEQTQQMYNVLNRVLMSQSVTEANSMIGKEVEFAVRDKDGSYKTETGIVSSVKVEGGLVYLITEDNKTYELNQSIGFKDVKSQSITEAGLMIGKEVEFAVKDSEGKITTEKGIVSSVKVEDGKIYLITNKDKKYEISQVTGFGEIKEPSKPEENPEIEETPEANKEE